MKIWWESLFLTGTNGDLVRIKQNIHIQTRAMMGF